MGARLQVSLLLLQSCNLAGVQDEGGGATLEILHHLNHLWHLNHLRHLQEKWCRWPKWRKRYKWYMCSKWSKRSKLCKIARFQDCGPPPSSCTLEQDWQDRTVKSCPPPPFRAKQACLQSCLPSQKFPKVLQTKISKIDCTFLVGYPTSFPTHTHTHTPATTTTTTTTTMFITTSITGTTVITFAIGYRHRCFCFCYCYCWPYYSETP